MRPPNFIPMEYIFDLFGLSQRWMLRMSAGITSSWIVCTDESFMTILLCKCVSSNDTPFHKLIRDGFMSYAWERSQLEHCFNWMLFDLAELHWACRICSWKAWDDSLDRVHLSSAEECETDVLITGILKNVAYLHWYLAIKFAPSYPINLGCP